MKNPDKPVLRPEVMDSGLRVWRCTGYRRHSLLSWLFFGPFAPVDRYGLTPERAYFNWRHSVGK